MWLSGLHIYDYVYFRACEFICVVRKQNEDISAYHLRKHVPVVAVNLGGEVVHTQHIVRTVGQDTGTIRGPS